MKVQFYQSSPCWLLKSKSDLKVSVFFSPAEPARPLSAINPLWCAIPKRVSV